MKIGFIGLGIMGKPMAKNLIKAGYELYVYNRSRPVMQEMLKEGAQLLDSPMAVAQSTDLIIMMLPDSPDVEEVVNGNHGLLQGIRSGHIVVDMSSIDPNVTRKISSKLVEYGATMLDAPVSGGESGAIQATLAIMVGGPKTTYNLAYPVLQKLGTSITHVGEIGSGNVVKLINQMIVAINIAAVSEAVQFSKKSGIDAMIVYDAIKGGLAGSKVLDSKIAKMANEEFSPGFRLELHRKDLRNALLFSNQLNLELPLSSLMASWMDQLINQGYGKEDHSAIYRKYKEDE